MAGPERIGAIYFDRIRIYKKLWAGSDLNVKLEILPTAIQTVELIIDRIKNYNAIVFSLFKKTLRAILGPLTVAIALFVLLLILLIGCYT